MSCKRKEAENCYQRIIAAFLLPAALLAGARCMAGGTDTPAAFGVDLPTYTHLGFGGNDETMKVYAQADMLKRLSGVQLTYGASGIWSYKSPSTRMWLFGITGSKSIGSGRVVFDGLPTSDHKRDYDAEIGRFSAQVVRQLWIHYDRFENTDVNRLQLLSLVMSAGLQSTSVDFPEENTTVNGDGEEFALGLVYEWDYLVGQVLHASALVNYRKMDFDNLFTKSGMNNEPVELQLRAGAEIYVPSGWNFSMDVISAVGEAKNFSRYGFEIGMRYNY